MSNPTMFVVAVMVSILSTLVFRIAPTPMIGYYAIASMLIGAFTAALLVLNWLVERLAIVLDEEEGL